jgi:hypothetical protein
MNNPIVSVDVKEHVARKCRVVGAGVTEAKFIAVDGSVTLLGSEPGGSAAEREGGPGRGIPDP